MNGRSKELEKVRALCDQVIALAERDPSRAQKLASALQRLLAPSSQREGVRRNRRPPPVLDPFEIHRAEPDALKQRLSSLSLDQLRDIVAHHSMDPRRLVMKWKDRDRVIAHIEETVSARSRKGEAFRSFPDRGPSGSEGERKLGESLE